MLRTRMFQLAKEQGRTKTWLARQLGIDYSYLYLIETGKRPIPKWMPAKAAAIFGLPESMLFFHEDLSSDKQSVSTGSTS